MFSVELFNKVKVYVGDIANPANGMTLDFSQLQECGYFEGPATDGGPHVFECNNAPLTGRHVVVTNVDTSTLTPVLYICEVIVCTGPSETQSGRCKCCTVILDNI